MNYKETAIKILTECSRLLIGVVFIFSGFVKAVDPMGGAIKIGDYLTSFGLDMLQPFTVLASFCPFGCRVCHGCLYVVRGIPPLQLFPCFTFYGIHDAADVVSCDIQSGFRLRLFRGCSRYYELGDVF